MSASGRSAALKTKASHIFVHLVSSALSSFVFLVIPSLNTKQVAPAQQRKTHSIIDPLHQFVCGVSFVRAFDSSGELLLLSLFLFAEGDDPRKECAPAVSLTPVASNRSSGVVVAVVSCAAAAADRSSSILVMLTIAAASVLAMMASE